MTPGKLLDNNAQFFIFISLIFNEKIIKLENKVCALPFQITHFITFELYFITILDDNRNRVGLSYHKILKLGRAT